MTLACGYSPLRLETFLTAYLARALPQRRIELSTGLYADLPGTLSAVAKRAGRPHGIALSIEWPDLDPRLGYRNLGGWRAAGLADIVSAARARLDWIAAAIEALPAGVALAVAGPTVAPAPFAHTPSWHASPAELELRQAFAGFMARAARAGAKALNATYLDRRTVLDERFDARSELFAGFPFTREHAANLAEGLVRLLLPENPQKGLITDLDDRLWKGLVGEIGADAVAWDLDGKAQIHGLYQQLLASLSEQGTLLAIASKNEASNVETAFARPDIRVPLDAFFPVEAHWNPKSSSVGRILDAWNVGADSVLFIDDSPAELAEVQAAHPDVECILFPKGDPAAALGLFQDLRDKLGKSNVQAEDALRLQSLRSGAALKEASDADDALDRFLSSAQGKLTIDAASEDARTLELVNKTNQFNLNGIRYTEGDWAASRERPGAFTYSMLYEDKFGPLGTIAVVHGRKSGSDALVDVWVMSCRAFSRRIEYHALEALFNRLGVERIELSFTQTPKNAPLASFLLDVAGPERRSVSLDAFRSAAPALHHQVNYAE